ncbi:glycosyltransferase family 2 protein [Candidatus Bathyarchaeota archaeon]|nr:glycosyltransferase family 2 protein [Candidatus Bathyarchaeota archaeon]
MAPVTGRPRVIACIPAYNEEGTIAKVVVQAQRHVDKVVVCDDGSEDLTGLIAERLGAEVIRHERNMGKGAALRDLFRRSLELGAEAVVALDADGQHDPGDIPRLLRPIMDGSADMVVGRRVSDGAPGYRRLGRRLLDMATGVRGGEGEQLDTQSGFRAFSRRFLEAVEVAEPGFAVDSELLMKAGEGDFKILEVPVGSMFKGVRRSPILHGLEVLGGILTLLGERHPIPFLGLPGLAMAAAGVYGWLWVAERFEEVGQLPLGHALVYTVLLLIGVFAMFMALTLFTVRNIIMRYRG